MNQQRPYLFGRRFGCVMCIQCLLYVVLLSHPTSLLHAQRMAWNWYFGTAAGITFANGLPEPLTDGRIDTDEGCAVMSNPANGALMFYTDGSEVRNSFHQVMPNGSGLQGERSTSQSAMILPWPGSTDLFAIFNPAPITAIDPGNRCLCLKYSVVDMRRDGGFGDVIAKNVFVTDGITEHITATQDCDGTGWWIVVRLRESSRFHTYHLTADGLSSLPVVSPSLPGAEIRDAGQMKASPDGSMIVITSPSGTTQLYRFMRATGELFAGIDLFGKDRTGIHYGAAFTADSRYLYVASTTLTPTEGTQITRFDLAEYNPQKIIESRSLVGFIKGTTAFTPLQLAPDKNIYIGRPNEKHLASISNPAASTPTIIDTAVLLTGYCRSGLPYFLDWYFAPHVLGNPACRIPVAYAEDKVVCVNECVQLVDGSQGEISSWSWNIPNGTPTSPRIPSPVVCFSKAGLHKATLTVSNAYGDDTTEVLINVVEQPKVFVPPVVRTCPGKPVTLPAVGAAQYRWSPSTGLNDPNIAQPVATLTESTLYTVVGISSEGCRDTVSVLVTVDSMYAGGNVTVCPGGTATLRASGAETYQWEPQTLVSDPASATPTATPTTTTTFTVTMRVGSCTVVDSVTVYVEPTFSVQIEGPSVACAGDVVTVRASGGGSDFAWTGTGVKPSASNETQVLLEGTTTVVVVAHSGTCVSTDSLTIELESGPAVNTSADTTICNGSIATLSASGNAVRYEWHTTNGELIEARQTTQVAPSITTAYVVYGYGQGACVSLDTVVVTVQDVPTVHAGPTKRVCLGSAVRLSATGVADTYSWEPTEGLDNPTVLAPIATPTKTTTYTITSVRNGCVAVDSTTVYVSSLDLVAPNDVKICQGSATELTLTGATAYIWEPADGLSDPTVPNPIVAPKTSTTYRVRGFDAIGCEDEIFVRVTVIDTTSLTIRAATVSALAGTSNLEIPILVDADPTLLPMFADSLRADIIVPSDVLLPTGFDRGRLSISTRGTDRVIRLVLPNVQIVNPNQRINSLYGTVLAGSLFDAPIRFEKVEWVGITCPTSSSTPGRLLVTGCYLEGRSLRFFNQTDVVVTSKPSSGTIDVEIKGTEPGVFTVQLFSVDGSLLNQEVRNRQFAGVGGTLQCTFTMQGFSSGMYYVVTNTPTIPYVSRIVWLP